MFSFASKYICPICDENTWWEKMSIKTLMHHLGIPLIISTFDVHTGTKAHFLSRNSLNFDSSEMWILWKTRLTAPSAPLGSAFGGGELEKFQEILSKSHFTWFRVKKWRKKIFKKIREKFRNFFSIFPKFFSVEIFHIMCRLCIQSFMILRLTVPEIQGVTNRQTDLGIYYICRRTTLIFSARNIPILDFC